MAIPVWSGVTVGTVGSKLKRIIEAYPGDKSKLYITSALRSGDSGSHHSGLSYDGSPTAAIDIGFGYPSNTAEAKKLADWLYQFSGDTVELIHSNDRGGRYVKNQKRVGAYAAAEHWNHVHFATSSKLADKILAKLGAGGKTASGAPDQPSQGTVSVMPYYGRPVIRKGDKGGAVGHAQFLLYDRLGILESKNNPVFGPKTDAAVRTFQRRYAHLEVDGIIGPQTWSQLEVAAAQAISAAGRPVLRQGSEGMWVGYLQHTLRKAGYDIDDVQGFPFGPQTYNAVRQFQGKYDVPGGVDGVVGKETWEAIDALDKGKLKVPPGGGSTPPSPPSSPGAVSPPELVKMKDQLLDEADQHGLTGLGFLGIAPSTASAYGYHNSRDRHVAGLTRDGVNDYSVQTSLDKQGDGKYFSALDIGGNTTNGRMHTRIMTDRLRRAVENDDPRVKYLREFYGTLDGENVYGRTHSSLDGEWKSSSADDTHLFHVHLSFFRKYVNDPAALKAVKEVLLSIPLAEPPSEPPSEPKPEEPEGPEVSEELKELMKEVIDLLQQIIEE